MGVTCSSNQPAIQSPICKNFHFVQCFLVHQCYPMDYFVECEEELMHQGLVCSICMGVIKEAYRDKCGHVFGKECIKRWLNRNDVCPLSRKSIKKNIKKDYQTRNIISKLEVNNKEIQQLIKKEFKDVDYKKINQKTCEVDK